MRTMREPLETLGKRRNANDQENRAQRVRVPYRPLFVSAEDKPFRLFRYFQLSRVHVSKVMTFVKVLSKPPSTLADSI